MGIFSKARSDTLELNPRRSFQPMNSQEESSVVSEDTDLGSAKKTRRIRRPKLPKFRRLESEDELVAEYEPPKNFMPAPTYSLSSSFDQLSDATPEKKPKKKNRPSLPLVKKPKLKKPTPIKGAKFQALEDMDSTQEYEPPKIFLEQKVGMSYSSEQTFDVNTDKSATEFSPGSSKFEQSSDEFRQFVFDDSFKTIKSVEVKTSSSGSTGVFSMAQVAAVTASLQESFSEEDRSKHRKNQSNPFRDTPSISTHRPPLPPSSTPSYNNPLRELQPRHDKEQDRQEKPKKFVPDDTFGKRSRPPSVAESSFGNSGYQGQYSTTGTSFDSRSHDSVPPPRAIVTSGNQSVNWSVVSNVSVANATILAEDNESPFFSTSYDDENDENDPFRVGEDYVNDRDWIPQGDPFKLRQEDNDAKFQHKGSNSRTPERRSKPRDQLRAFSQAQKEDLANDHLIASIRASSLKASKHKPEPQSHLHKPDPSPRGREPVELDAAVLPSPRVSSRALSDKAVSAASQGKARVAADLAILPIRKGKAQHQLDTSAIPFPREITQVNSDTAILPSPQGVPKSCSDSVLDFSAAGSRAQSFMSPQQRPPTGLPSNAILASMLFRQTCSDSKVPRSKNLLEEDEESGQQPEIPPAIKTSESTESDAGSNVSSITEEASSFYQKNFQSWKKQAHNALNNYHYNRKTALRQKDPNQYKAQNWLERVEEDHINMFRIETVEL